VFAPGQIESHDDAGHCVADPGQMLLAASLMLGEGLRERHAADTLSAALGAARAARSGPVAAVRRTLSTSTRDFSDTVVRLLPTSHRGAEFLNEATG
jgi:isocitrate/isopropylmalate dehydrogenase